MLIDRFIVVATAAGGIPEAVEDGVGEEEGARVESVEAEVEVERA